MNLTLWLLNSLLIGLWTGAELPRRAPLLVFLFLAPVGFGLSYIGAIPPIHSLPELAASLGTIGVLCLWLLISNRRAYRDRVAMIIFLRDNHGLPDWWVLSEAAAGTIPYSDHLLGYACFQHPMKYFPSILQLAVERAPSLRELRRRVRTMKKEHSDA